MLTTVAQAQSGMLDTSFDPGTGANNGVFGITMQDDGRILIGGQFTTYNGIGVISLARLHGDGTLDGTFNTGTGAGDFGFVRKILLQDEEKIVV